MLTLKQKREIVKLFKSGCSLPSIAMKFDGVWRFDAENVIRDYLNGKFSLSKPKPKSELDYPRRRG